jgi:hypothetical protein
MSDTSTVKKTFNLETPDQKITRKTQVQMGGHHQRGHLPNEDQKLDSLRPGSKEMGGGGR